MWTLYRVCTNLINCFYVLTVAEELKSWPRYWGRTERWFLPARRYGSAGIYCYGSVSFCPSLSVFMSVCHNSVFYRKAIRGQADWSGFWYGGFFLPVLHCVIRKLGYLNNKDISPRNFFLNSGRKKFRNGISIGETCFQLSSRKVDAESVIKWTSVIG